MCIIVNARRASRGLTEKRLKQLSGEGSVTPSPWETNTQSPTYMIYEKSDSDESIDVRTSATP